MYVLDAWYVAAWSHEVDRTPAHRTVCEIALVLYRRQDGTAVALEDRCAHRAYPLSAGQVKGTRSSAATTASPTGPTAAAPACRLSR